MPKSELPTSVVPTPEEAKLIFESIGDLRKKAHFALFWRTGARPSELAGLQRKHARLAKICRATWRKDLQLQRCNALSTIACDHCVKCGAELSKTQYFIITLPTLKLGENNTFKVRTRELRFVRPVGMSLDPYLETIVKYAQSLPTDDTKLFPRTVRHLQKWLRKHCMQVVGKPYTPYHFRHARFTIEGANGMGIKELQAFKGAASPQSVLGYLHSRPFEIETRD